MGMGEDERRLDQESSNMLTEEVDTDAAEAVGGEEVLDLDDQDEDLDQVMRAAAEAVESVESHRKVDVTRLEQELADLRDRSMRTLADFDNYRKRAERERQDAKRYVPWSNRCAICSRWSTTWSGRRARPAPSRICARGSR